MRKTYTLPNGWQLILWFDADRYDSEEIIDDLIRFGCRNRDLSQCENYLRHLKEDCGLTFSDYVHSRSVMVIGHASSSQEFSNTIAHEIAHLAVHIANTRGIDTDSEAFCYLVGDITQMIWQDSHRFTCPSCSCH